MTSEFYQMRPDELNFVPFDIETTGFTTDDIITNIVLHNDGSYHIWLNTDGDTDVDVDLMKNNVTAESGLENCVFHVSETEAGMMENLNEYVDALIDRDDSVIVAYNGEVFGGGGFDLSFMRTRCLRLGVAFPFKGYWYADPYEVFDGKDLFNTTVQSEPSLYSMQKGDLLKYGEDLGLTIDHEKMHNKEIIHAVSEYPDIESYSIEQFAKDENYEFLLNKDGFSNFNNKHYKAFIDYYDLDINYQKLSRSDIASIIEESPEHTQERLVEWHDETGLDIGTEDMSTLDDVHLDLFETVTDETLTRMPFDVERFDPFDPYEQSGEAVTGFLNGDYTGVVLHCLSDVAKTVNLTRAMAEYAPQSDYAPKIL